MLSFVVFFVVCPPSPHPHSHPHPHPHPSLWFPVFPVLYVVRVLFMDVGKLAGSNSSYKHIFLIFNISNTMTLALNTTSWNIRVISSPAKRTKILNHLHKLKSDICLLQETHLTEAESRKLRAGWIGQTYHSTYNSKKLLPFWLTKIHHILIDQLWLIREDDSLSLTATLRKTV